MPRRSATLSAIEASVRNLLVRLGLMTGAGVPAIPAGALAAANNLSDVASAATSRTNLQLGTMATVNSPNPIANGGTASTTDSAARTALGLAIGTDVQAYHTALASLATLGPSLVAGDVVYASAINALARLGVGSNGDVLTLAAGLPSWAAAGGGIPTGFTEVAAEGDLSAAIAANAAVYVSGNPATIASAITLTADRTIWLAPGVDLTYSGAQLLNTSTFRLTIICAGDNSIVTSGTSPTSIFGGSAASATAMLRVVGDLRVDASTLTAASQFLLTTSVSQADIDSITIASVNIQVQTGSSLSLGGINIGTLRMVGGGTSAYVRVLAGCRVGKLQLSGTWRAVTTSNPDTTYTVTCDGYVERTEIASTTSVLLFAGESSGAGRFESGQLIGAGTLYLSMAPSSAGFGAFGGLVQPLFDDAGGDYTRVYGPSKARSILGNTGARRVNCFGLDVDNSPNFTSELQDSVFFGGRFVGLTLNSASQADLGFHGVYFDTSFTFTESLRDRFIECHFEANQTIPAAMYPMFVGCRFDGTLTITSGAKARFVGCHLAAAPTNSDPTGTTFEACILDDGTLYDSRPSMRRFNESTLDAAIESLAHYYNLSQASGNLPNLAPYGVGGSLGASPGVAYAQTGKNGSCVDIDDTEYLFSSPGLASIGENEEFILNWWYNLDGAPGAAKLLAYIGTAAAYYQAVDIGTDRKLVFTGAGSAGIAGATALTAATWYMISLRRYNNAGTMTYQLYVNAASEGTATTAAGESAGGDASIMFGKGGGVTSFNNGRVDEVSLWKSGDAALITALYNSGTGRFLTVR